MTKTRKTSKLLIASMLLATSFVVLAPSAAAHVCTAEEDMPQAESCGAECTEGEAHNHTITHYHWWSDEVHTHYHCESTVTPPPPTECSIPRILGICAISEVGEICSAIQMQSLSERVEALQQLQINGLSC